MSPIIGGFNFLISGKIGMPGLYSYKAGRSYLTDNVYHLLEYLSWEM